MTAVLHSGSPGFEDDESQSWEFISAHAGSFAGSAGEYTSPSMNSQGSWVKVTNRTYNNRNNNNDAGVTAAAHHAAHNTMNVSQHHQHMRHLSTPSPIMSTAGTHTLSAASPYSTAAYGPTGGVTDNALFDFLQHAQQQQEPQFNVAHTQALLQDHFALNPQAFALEPPPSANDFIMPGSHNIGGFDPAMNFLAGPAYTTTAPGFGGPAQAHQEYAHQGLGIPATMQDAANVGSWMPPDVQQHDVFTTEQQQQQQPRQQFHATPPPRSLSWASSLSPRSSASPGLVMGKQQHEFQQRRSVSSNRRTFSASQSIKKPTGVLKAQRPRKTSQPSPRSATESTASPGPSDAGMLMFCNQTLDTWGKAPSPGSGVDAHFLERASHKGRKGALSETVRAHALRVRQTGACFCCHWRKVKCDGERPCRQCKKLCQQVPEAVCWKFQDFTTVIFSDFVRGHFRRDEMSRFVDANVASFTLGGVEVPARVALSSGGLFSTKLVLNAKFFTSRDPGSEVMQHWYQFLGANGVVELEALRAAPIGLDHNPSSADGGGSIASQRNELRRKIEAYVDALVLDPSYAVQLTDSIRKTTVPRRVLAIVQQYARTSLEAPIVRRALGIYAMHYVMTRHLTMTPQTIASLAAINPVSASDSSDSSSGGGGRAPFLTPRLLNRQIKTLVDDLLQQEVSALFDDFTRRLKTKTHKQWAPCMAAFCVFALLLEAIEGAADVYAITDNEIEMRRMQPARFRRAEALAINERIENMPFKQFAFQFHRVYETHSRDASANKAFNPLAGPGLREVAETDPAAVDLVLGLRNLLDFSWSELDWLSGDPILPNDEGHPYPMNVEDNYCARLVSKFLLSFQRPGYIFSSA